MGKFSKTILYNWIKTAAGVAAAFGVAFDSDAVVQHLDQISGSVIALWLILDGVFGKFLRKFTDSPVVRGIGGWLGKKQ